jgi:hypothetical protein
MRLVFWVSNIADSATRWFSFDEVALEAMRDDVAAERGGPDQVGRQIVHLGVDVVADDEPAALVEHAQALRCRRSTIADDATTIFVRKKTTSSRSTPKTVSDAPGCAE